MVPLGGIFGGALSGFAADFFGRSFEFFNLFKQNVLKIYGKVLNSFSNLQKIRHDSDEFDCDRQRCALRHR